MSDAISKAIEVLDSMDERLDAHGYLSSDNPRVDIAGAISGLQALQQSGEAVYAFRRKGVDDFCTCDAGRYLDLKAKPDFFEVAIFYTTPQPVVPEGYVLAPVAAIKKLQFYLEPYDDIKPREWATDRQNIRRAHELLKALLSAGKENKE